MAVVLLLLLVWVAERRRSHAAKNPAGVARGGHCCRMLLTRPVTVVAVRAGRGSEASSAVFPAFADFRFLTRAKHAVETTGFI